MKGVRIVLSQYLSPSSSKPTEGIVPFITGSGARGSSSHSAAQYTLRQKSPLPLSAGDGRADRSETADDQLW